MRARWFTLLVTLGACGGGDDDAAPRPRVTERAPLDAPTIDAAQLAAEVDDAEAVPVERLPPRERRVLEITLDSTPRGAAVMVDGVVVGNTPTYWEGEFNGCVREFRFEMRGYTTAVYRFVPVRDGFVHGHLERILEDFDGGTPLIVEPAAMPPCVQPAAPARPRRPPPRPAVAPIDAMPAPVDAGAPAD